MARKSIGEIKLAKVYPMYVAKVERKGRTAQEVEQVTCWLTGYDREGLERQLEADVDFHTFFQEAPVLNPHRDKITGVICGYRVEEIEDEMMVVERALASGMWELDDGRMLVALRKAPR